MRVELGNVDPVQYRVDEHGVPEAEELNNSEPSVTTWAVHDGAPYSVADNVDIDEVTRHIFQRPGLLMPGPGVPVVTHLPDHEALVSILNDWPNHSRQAPSWVSVSDDDFNPMPQLQSALATLWGAGNGRPDNVEDTHWTQYGSKLLRPGVGPLAGAPPELSKSNAGFNILWGTVFGWNAAGKSGTSTATGTTSMTDSGASFGTNVYSGAVVYCGNRYANIISHTTTVLTIDQWYDVTTPGSTSAGSTPGATTVYVIALNSAPAIFMGLTADTTAVGAGDTTLPSEITTAGGGLIRKICPLAHTSGATTGTLTPVFTANGSDSLAVTIGKVGTSSSIKSSLSNFTMTVLGTTATLSLSGDQLTITDTFTLS